MKMLLSFLLIALISFSGCELTGTNDENPKSEIETFFEISQNEIEVSAKGGEISTIVFSNKDWYISGEYDWCRPHIKNGQADENGSIVTFTIDSTNAKRIATFWFRCDDKQIRFTINQQQVDTLESVSDNRYYVSEDGSVIELVYKANVECEIIIPDDAKSWISINETRTIPDNTILLSIKENITFYERSAKVKISAVHNESLSIEYIISQRGLEPHLELSVEELFFSPEGGTQEFDIKANAKWYIRAEDSCKWVTIDPIQGDGDTTINVRVANNETIYNREAIVEVIVKHPTYGDWETNCIKIMQSYNESFTIIYCDDFDGKESTKTYGSYGSSWPYIDQFPDFTNTEGLGVADVTYSGSGVTVRSNNCSDSQYSDYDGSGINNLFFGTDAYLQINNIILQSEQHCYKLVFGGNRYPGVYQTSQFYVQLSKDGELWHKIETNHLGNIEGNWNITIANFSLTEIPEKLYIKFTSTVDSVYRIDDVVLTTGSGGQLVEL